MYLNLRDQMPSRRAACLTITWDVFEYMWIAACETAEDVFNYNMGCI